MFTFDEIDTRIFQYSKGERAADGTFKEVFADPAAIKRQLDISLPNRSQLIDQYLAGEGVKRAKANAVQAYLQDPAAYMTALAIRDHGYQPTLPDPAQPTPGATLPNPESVLDFVKRNAIATPEEFTGEENSTIRMAGIADQNLTAGIRAVFGLLDFDEKTGQGCTDYMAIAVMNHWQEWLEKKSGSTPDTPTSSPASPAA